MELDYSKPYEVIDNFLDEEVFQKIQDTMMGPTFPWHYMSHKVNKEVDQDHPYNYQLVHLFHKEDKPLSDFCPLLDPIWEKLNHNGKGRTKANLTTRTPEVMEFNMHTDYQHHMQDMRTAVFYLNDNNGYTRFEDGPTVGSIANRLIHFDSRLLHTGTTASDEKVRVVLNLNFLVRQ